MYGINPEDMPLKNIQVAQGRLLQTGDRNVVVLGGMVGQGFYDPNGGDDYVENETYEEYKARIYTKTQALYDKKIAAEFMNYETEKTKKLTLQVVGIMDKDAPNGYYAYAPLDVMQNIQKMMLTRPMMFLLLLFPLLFPLSGFKGENLLPFP